MSSNKTETSSLVNLRDCPTWQMDDAYGDIGDPRYNAAKRSLTEIRKRLEEQCNALPDEISPATVTAFSTALNTYEVGYETGSSLLAFLKCLGAKDGSRQDVGLEQAILTQWALSLDALATPLFQKLQKATNAPTIWNTLLTDPSIATWQHEIDHRSKDWVLSLSPESNALYTSLRQGPLTALNDIHKSLQRLIELEVHDAQGVPQTVKAAKLVSILKGHPDRSLRHETARAMEHFYAQHGELWAKALNTLHGIRLPFLAAANTTPLRISLWQNHMSSEALTSMVSTIQEHLDRIQDAVRYRAKIFESELLPYEDLLAPCPLQTKSTGSASEVIPYAEALSVISESLAQISPEMGHFPQMMLERGWIDAAPSEKKIGGAFYTRFNALKMPRVFSSYTGTLSSVLQQAHELGHAFHYWVMRDLPSIETEFPMTLTETASTFNEALVRETLLQRASHRDQFSMLWQDMRSAANFLLHTMTRWDFEMKLFDQLANGYVNSAQLTSLMTHSWKAWFGDTATVDSYLWAYKLHFYKTDQWVYNYPYTVGYLMSQALLEEKDRRGSEFYAFYRELLRDTGRLSVDEIIERHFNLALDEFWRQAIARVLRRIDDFKKYFENEKFILLNH